MSGLAERFIQYGWNMFGEQIVVGVDFSLWQVLFVLALLLMGIQFGRRYGRALSREPTVNITYTTERIQRMDVIARAFHWVDAGSVIVLFITGFALLAEGSLGQAPLLSWLWWHIVAAVAWIVAILFHIFDATIRGDFREMWPTGKDISRLFRIAKNFFGADVDLPLHRRYPVLQIGLHWVIAGLFLALAVTGVIMWRSIPMPWWSATRVPFGLGEAGQGLTYTIHGIVGGLLLAVLVGHIYFALREWGVSKGMFRGWITPEAYEHQFDPREWRPEGVILPMAGGSGDESPKQARDGECSDKEEVEHAFGT